jgi:4-amino-4-deoxy-L-arabinose transferase-like glycosyltransferase
VAETVDLLPQTAAADSDRRGTAFERPDDEFANGQYRRPVRRDIALLVVIVLLGAGLRLLWIQAPLLDAHRWRQADTAAIARNLYEGRFNLFYPEVDWGGRNGYVESEFPLVPALAAGLYEVFGPLDYLGRVIAMVFSTATIVALFFLGAELLGVAGGLAAAFLLSVSPAAVFFGRTFMPDSPMLFFWVAGVLAFVRYFRSGSRRALWLGGAAMMLACLIKVPAVLMVAPIAGAAWQAKGRTALRDRALWVAVLVPGLVTMAWYAHAFLLYKQTGITFGILVHPARTYPPDIAPGPWKYAFSKWSSVALLMRGDFYMTLLSRLYEILLLPWGFVGALFGALLWRRDEGRLVADAWFAALAAFVLLMGEAHIGHEYYQLPVVPLGALYFGAFARPAFARRDGPAGRSVRVGSTALLAGLLILIGATGFYYSGIINSHFRPTNPDVRVLEAGQAVERVVPADDLMVVVDDYGVTSPLLLYFAHRKGWSFDVEDVYPQVIDGLKRRGARFFVSTVWSRIERERPETATYLRVYQSVELRGAPRDMAVFDLTKYAD